MMNYNLPGDDSPQGVPMPPNALMLACTVIVLKGSLGSFESAYGVT